MAVRVRSLCALLLLSACFSRGSSITYLPDDGGGGGGDQSAEEEDLSGGAEDLLGRDLLGITDLRSGGTDLRGPDSDLRPPADMRPARPPCTRGPGFVAWRFHYEPGSTSARLDIYSLPDRSNWEAVPAYATMTVDHANGGGINIASGNWILIRYSVVGLTTINGATLSMYGRSYSVSTSGSFEGWSPIYGGKASPINSVSNAWPYRWTSVDFTGYVRVGDPPGLTGIRFYARGNSNNLVINTVELCIDGS